MGRLTEMAERLESAGPPGVPTPVADRREGPESDWPADPPDREPDGEVLRVELRPSGVPVPAGHHICHGGHGCRGPGCECPCHFGRGARGSIRPPEAHLEDARRERFAGYRRRGGGRQAGKECRYCGEGGLAWRWSDRKGKWYLVRPGAERGELDRCPALGRAA